MRIKKSEIKNILKESLNVHEVNDEMELLKLFKDNLINVNNEMDNQLKNDTYDLKYCYKTYIKILKMCDLVNNNIFKPENVLRYSSTDKIYFLIDLKTELEKLQICIDILISKIAQKIKNKNSSFSVNPYNKKSIETENNIDKLFQKADNKHIQPILKKLTDLIKEMRTHLVKINKKYT